MKMSVNTLFADEDVWLTQAQLVDIYQSSKSNISEHLTNIFADKELDKDAVVRKFRTTAADGKNYQVQYYNLDVIIALGYRVQSPIAVRFRRWATRLLHEYIQKGFTMDDERLKQGGNRYFKELLQRIRDRRRYKMIEINLPNVLQIKVVKFGGLGKMCYLCHRNQYVKLKHLCL